MPALCKRATSIGVESWNDVHARVQLHRFAIGEPLGAIELSRRRQHGADQPLDVGHQRVMVVADAVPLDHRELGIVPAAALAIAVLSKEIAVALVVPFVVLVWRQSPRESRGFAVVGWSALTLGVMSIYPLMALLKGEFFPAGSPLGGAGRHVSLICSMAWQSSRDKDGGLLDGGSQFWSATLAWAHQEPLLVFGGTACALLAITLFRRNIVLSMLGWMVICLWLFIGRGGIVLDFYLVPALPLLALTLALVVQQGVADVRRAAPRRFATPTSRVAIGLALAACLGMAALAYNRSSEAMWTATRRRADAGGELDRGQPSARQPDAHRHVDVDGSAGAVVGHRVRQRPLLLARRPGPGAAEGRVQGHLAHRGLRHRDAPAHQRHEAQPLPDRGRGPAELDDDQALRHRLADRGPPRECRRAGRAAPEGGPGGVPGMHEHRRLRAAFVLLLALAAFAAAATSASAAPSTVVNGDLEDVTGGVQPDCFERSGWGDGTVQRAALDRRPHGHGRAAGQDHRLRERRPEAAHHRERGLRAPGDAGPDLHAVCLVQVDGCRERAHRVPPFLRGLDVLDRPDDAAGDGRVDAGFCSHPARSRRHRPDQLRHLARGQRHARHRRLQPRPRHRPAPTSAPPLPSSRRTASLGTVAAPPPAGSLRVGATPR